MNSTSKDQQLFKEVSSILNGERSNYTYKRHGIPPLWGYYEILCDNAAIYAVSNGEEANEILALLKGAFALGFIEGRK